MGVIYSEERSRCLPLTYSAGLALPASPPNLQQTRAVKMAQRVPWLLKGLV